MREYKFRIRCKRVINETSYSSITTIETKIITLKQLETHWIMRHFSDECTEILSIDQYIGLNDKDNKEMFENDIILDDKGNYATIEYSSPSWFGRYKYGKDIKGGLGNLTDGWREVVGNIYDNPKLLEIET